MKHNNTHTGWCGRGHLCNLGEHRSHPQSWRTPYGGLTATLVQHDRRAYLELRIQIAIPSDETSARQAAAEIATDVDTTIRRITRRHTTIGDYTHPAPSPTTHNTMTPAAPRPPSPSRHTSAQRAPTPTQPQTVDA